MTVEPITKRKSASEPTLWEAFAAAQAEFGPIIKNTKGARGNYAPLDAVLETVRPVLNKHGLALTQATFVADGTLFVRCSVVHVATGETHSAEYPAGGFGLQHQQLGAGVTYARRYSLLSILGVFPENEDDDGEKAGTAGGERPPAQTPPRQQKVINPETGREIDPNNARNSREKWRSFCARIRAFTDIDDLEAWWASGSTQAAIDQMPWEKEAAEEYEKAQERLMNAGRP